VVSTIRLFLVSALVAFSFPFLRLFPSRLTKAPPKPHNFPQRLFLVGSTKSGGEGGFQDQCARCVRRTFFKIRDPFSALLQLLLWPSFFFFDSTLSTFFPFPSLWYPLAPFLPTAKTFRLRPAARASAPGNSPRTDCLQRPSLLYFGPCPYAQLLGIPEIPASKRLSLLFQTLVQFFKL